MVHRPADSRLLANLLSHEKDYSKYLVTLLESSNASLASFSAYAAASSPPASHAILAVAGSLAGADDALRHYASAVEQWREHLTALKTLEEEVGNIMRDREIFVTRLIKASKNQKPSRDSLLLNQPYTSGGSSSSIRSEFSLASSSKLTSAQAELQACEAHLAVKERELEVRRISAIRDGMTVRCQAMVECGWAWGEMGKEAMRALETLSVGEHQHPPRPPLSQSPSEESNYRDYNSTKPLPDPRPSSDLSSLAPSQSASQINLAESSDQNHSSLQIPPAHSISEFASLPTSTSTPSLRSLPVTPQSRHILSRRITEEDLQPSGGSSDEEEKEIGPVEVVENPRFAGGANSSNSPSSGLGKKFSLRHGAKSDLGPSTSSTSISGLPRRGGFFGSLKGLFRSHKGDRDRDRDRDGGSDREPERATTTPTKKTGGWATRTDRNLRGGDSSDEDEVNGTPFVPVMSSPSAGNRSRTMSESGVGLGNRLRKTSTVKRKPKVSASLPTSDVGSGAGGDGAKKAEEWLGEQGLFMQQGKEPKKSLGKNDDNDDGDGEKGWATDGGAPRTVPRKKSKVKKAGTRPGLLSEPPAMDSNLSRNSSITSSMSAPLIAKPKTGVARRASVGHAPAVPTRTPSHSAGAGVGGHKRAMTIDHATPPKRINLPPPHAGGGQGGASLMSIVEDVAKQNRLGWSPTDGLMSIGGTTRKVGPGTRMGTGTGTGTETTMEVIKAPRSITRREIDSTTMPTDVKRGRSSDAITTQTLPSERRTPTPPADGPTPPRTVNHGSLLTPSRPAMSPLRSAMRNPSRTPSPMPQLPSTSPEPQSPLSVTTPLPNGNALAPPELKAKGKTPETQSSDGASISSYETGHESFDDGEGDETEHEHSPEPKTHPLPSVPASPPHSPTPLRVPDNQHLLQSSLNSNHNHLGSDLSTSTASTELASSSPKRRKSVRVSLQPTFSPTPPALESDDESDHAPWNGKSTGWQTRNHHHSGDGEVKDMWEDSSDEDPEYQKAKRLLSRAGKKHDKKRR